VGNLPAFASGIGAATRDRDSDAAAVTASGGDAGAILRCTECIACIIAGRLARRDRFTSSR
jgi:hypothetical protein